MYYVKFSKTHSIPQLEDTASDAVQYELAFEDKQAAVVFFVDVVFPGGFSAEPSDYALRLFDNSDVRTTYFTNSITDHIIKSFIVKTNQSTV